MTTAREQVFEVIKTNDGMFPWQIAEILGVKASVGVAPCINIMKTRGQIYQKNGMYFAEPTWEPKEKQKKAECQFCGNLFTRGWNKDKHEKYCSKRN